MDYKYILYTHFKPPETTPKPEAIVKAFAGRLKRMLERDEWPGLLMLFYDKGWLELLNTHGQFDAKDLMHALKQAEEFCESSVLVDLKKKTDHVRVLSVFDLFPIVQDLRARNPTVAIDLARFLSGESTTMHYDTSKVVEAIVRLRCLGTGIPVLRIDWDALFNDGSLPDEEDWSRRLLEKAMPLAVKKDKESYSDPSFSGFMHSGSYKKGEDDFAGYAASYATRVLPAIPVPVDDDKNDFNSNPDGYLSKIFDPNLAERFLEEIGKIGANKDDAVISGALLSLSDAVVLDLPPFSNVDVLVSWIDDHLRFALHSALGTFASEMGPPTAVAFRPRIKNCSVKKERSSQNKEFFRYVLGNYLPTLVRGCIFDAWIQPYPHEPGATQPTPFVSALRDAMRTRRLPEEKADRLRAELRESALERLAVVKMKWADLTAGDRPSLAAAWVKGEIRKHPFPEFKPKPSDSWLGWGLYDGEELRDCVKSDVDHLVDMAIGYIDWTLAWPDFVASIRAQPRGTLALDLEWTGGTP